MHVLEIGVVAAPLEKFIRSDLSNHLREPLIDSRYWVNLSAVRAVPCSSLKDSIPLGE